MAVNDAQAPSEHLDPVRVEILGRSDYMEEDRLALISELTNYMHAEGLSAEIYFREPGGMGFPPLEVINVFIGTSIASALVGAAAERAVKAGVAWARECIRRRSDAAELPDEVTVEVTLYGPKGEFLKHISVPRDTVDTDPL